jgi:hypothetical protein
MPRDVYLTRALVSVVIGGIVALATALGAVRGVIGSKSSPSEPYRRDEDPGSFWTMAICLWLLAAGCAINGVINLFRFFEFSN